MSKTLRDVIRDQGWRFRIRLWLHQRRLALAGATICRFRGCRPGSSCIHEVDEASTLVAWFCARCSTPHRAVDGGPACRYSDG